MPWFFANQTFALAAAALLSAACSIVQPLPLPGADAPVIELRRDVNLPAEVAAYLCAASCRTALPSAELAMPHAGAPVRRSGPDGYEVSYLQNDVGRWFCRSEGRLRPQPFLGPAHALAVQFQAEATAPPLRASGELRLHITVTPTANGCRVAGQLQLLAGAMLVHDIDALLRGAAAEREIAVRLARGEWDAGLSAARTAIADNQAGGGPTMAPLLARLQVQQAAAHEGRGELQQAWLSLRGARLSDPDLGGTSHWSAQLAERLGRDDSARTAYLTSALDTDDPTVRASASLGLQRLRHRQQQGAAGLLTAAVDQLQLDEVSSAGSLLTAARARSPDQAGELRVLRAIQLARGDGRAALATALLMREYAPDRASERLVFDGYREVGAETLAARSQARIQTTPLLATPPN